MLRIRDPQESLHFYIDLMGMRTVFTMNTGPFTIYYLGYPQTDEHREDPVKFGIGHGRKAAAYAGIAGVVSRPWVGEAALRLLQHRK